MEYGGNVSSQICEINSVCSTACDAYHYGKECKLECNCAFGGTCNNTVGCVCNTGWEGERCDKDVKECEDESRCDQGKLCVELLGGYACDCPEGKEKLTNGTCASKSGLHVVIRIGCKCRKINE